MSPYQAARSACRLLIALCLLAAPFLATSAFAEYEAGSFGGGGGKAFRASCTPKALTALYAFVGSALDRVDLICGTLHKNGTVTEALPTGAYFGGSGGKLQGQYCPENALVTGMKVWMDYNKQVNGFILRCTYMTNGIETWTTMQVGGEHYDNPQTILCKKNEVGIGIYGRSGNLIDKLGLLCADNPMKVAQAPAPPPPPCPEGQIRLNGVCQVPPLLPGTQTGAGGGFIQMFPQGGGGGSPAASSGVLSCQGGGGMRMISSSQAGAAIAFAPATQAADAAPPGPGECAWQDRVFAADEPHLLGVTFDKPNVQLLFDAMRGGTFQVHASSIGTGFMVDSIDDVQVAPGVVVSPGPAAEGAGDAGEPAQGGDAGAPGAGGDEGGTAPMGGGGMAMESGDCPAGTATVTTPPGLDFLNVRERPAMTAKVVGQIPNGSQVTVAGACLQPAAGFAKKQTLKPQGDGAPAGDAGGGMAGGTPAATSAWCRIEQPKQGCVSAEFLAFGDAAPLHSAAGFAKAKTSLAKAGVGPSFAGNWNANADDVAYTMQMKQNGGSVTGSYQGADGSKGSFNGTVAGKVLRFSWKQTDGYKGTGKFTLADDGQSFDGSYNFGSNPDKVEGNWTGTRK